MTLERRPINSWCPNCGKKTQHKEIPVVAIDHATELECNKCGWRKRPDDKDTDKGVDAPLK